VSTLFSISEGKLFKERLGGGQAWFPLKAGLTAESRTAISRREIDCVSL